VSVIGFAGPGASSELHGRASMRLQGGHTVHPANAKVPRLAVRGIAEDSSLDGVRAEIGSIEAGIARTVGRRRPSPFQARPNIPLSAVPSEATPPRRARWGQLINPAIVGNGMIRFCRSGTGSALP
jgi:hypothetical protein